MRGRKVNNRAAATRIVVYECEDCGEKFPSQMAESCRKCGSKNIRITAHVTMKDDCKLIFLSAKNLLRIYERRDEEGLDKS